MSFAPAFGGQPAAALSGEWARWIGVESSWSAILPDAGWPRHEVPRIGREAADVAASSVRGDFGFGEMRAVTSPGLR